MGSLPPELHWGLPKAWSDLPIEQSFLAPAYQEIVGTYGAPINLEQWGQHVESSVDLAFRWTQMEHCNISFAETKGLPKAYRGRCKARVPKQRRPPCVLRRARAGDFNPDVEVVKPQHVKMVRQLRRVQALVRRLKKYGADIPDSQIVSLEREWNAILRSDALGTCFVAWCCHMPELGPPASGIPCLDYVFTLQQLLQHDVQIALAAVQKQQQLLGNYMQHTDAKLRGSSKAFAVMRDTFSAPLSQLHEKVEDTGLLTPEGDGFRIYCEHASLFQRDMILQVQGQPARVSDQDDYSLLVQFPAIPDHLPNEVTLMQQQISITASEISSQLQSYWHKLWWVPDPSPPVSDMFDETLQTLPNVCQNLVVDLSDLDRWLMAIGQMKGHSCRGVDAISAAELKHFSSGYP